MSPARDIRQKTWTLLTGRWLLRLVVVAAALAGVYAIVDGLLSHAFASLGITTLRDYAANVSAARVQKLAWTLPTTRAYVWMVGGALLSAFIALVFFGIYTFGVLRTCFKVVSGDERRWFQDAFGGFARPLELAWLFFCQAFAVAACALLGTLASAAIVAATCGACAALGGVPGALVAGVGTSLASAVFIGSCLWATYRYRLAWYLKADHPDWSAIACVTKARKLIDGYKWKAFCVDCSFAGWILFAFAILIACALGFVALSAFSAASGGASFVLSVVRLAVFVGANYLMLCVCFALTVSHVVFYRELREERPL